MNEFLQAIRALWTVIKNETVENSNTAIRVGAAGEQIVDALIDIDSQITGAVETLAQQISDSAGYFRGYLIHLADFSRIRSSEASSDPAIDRHPDYVFGAGAQDAAAVTPVEGNLCVRLTGADTLTIEIYESGAWVVKNTFIAQGGDLWSSLSMSVEYYYGIDKWNINSSPAFVPDNITLELASGIGQVKNGGIGEIKLEATLATKINQALTSPQITQIQKVSSLPATPDAAVMYCIAEA